MQWKDPAPDVLWLLLHQIKSGKKYDSITMHFRLRFLRHMYFSFSTTDNLRLSIYRAGGSNLALVAPDEEHHETAAKVLEDRTKQFWNHVGYTRGDLRKLQEHKRLKAAKKELIKQHQGDLFKIEVSARMRLRKEDNMVNEKQL